MADAPTASRKPVVGFVLSLVGGFMVLLFALLFVWVALVVGSAFQAIGGAVAGEVGGAAGGSVGTDLMAFAALALLCAVMMMVGAFLLWKGKRVAGGVVIIVFSILSLVFAAGGWFIGFILGLLGGILGLLGK